MLSIAKQESKGEVPELGSLAWAEAPAYPIGSASPHQQQQQQATAAAQGIGVTADHPSRGTMTEALLGA